MATTRAALGLLAVLALGVSRPPLAGAAAQALTVPPPAMSAMSDDDACAEARRRMVEQLRGREISDPAVLAAVAAVPRHLFVPAEERGKAYADQAVPIGSGQTISQPYIVALMTSLLELKPGARVLEVGTGSGYQAAVLSRLAVEVYTIEILRPLAERARRTLADLGYRNVHLRVGDGFQGWPEAAPFDAIVVTAAAPRIPQPLIDQLKPGGRMVIPVGGDYSVQQLLVLDKQADGRTLTRRTLPVRFVPLTRSAPR